LAAEDFVRIYRGDHPTHLRPCVEFPGDPDSILPELYFTVAIASPSDEHVGSHPVQSLDGSLVVVVGQIVLGFADIVDEDVVVVTSRGQVGRVSLDPTDLLMVIAWELPGDDHGSGIVGLQLPVFGPSVDTISIPLNARDSVSMGLQIIASPIFVVVEAFQAALRVPQSNLAACGTKMNRVENFTTAIYIVLSSGTVSVELFVVVKGHIVEEKLISVAHTDEIAVRPVQQIRVVVVAPAIHPELADGLRRSLDLRNCQLLLSPLLDFFDSVLPHWLVLEKRLL
jgi:hypothetical protein